MTAWISGTTNTTAHAGAALSADYKLAEGSDISLRGLYSNFRNWGHKFVYTMNDVGLYDPTNPTGNAPAYSQDWRRPNMAVAAWLYKAST